MEKNAKIYVAGNTGLVGSAIVRKLKSEGYNNLIFTEYPEYDLRNQQRKRNTQHHLPQKAERKESLHVATAPGGTRLTLAAKR